MNKILELTKRLHLVSVMLVFFFMSMAGCQSSADLSDKRQAPRATLEDLANEQASFSQEKQVNITELTKAQREAKLMSLYQAMLTAEPNANVRAKIAYRLAQIDTQHYEALDVIDESSENALKKGQSDQALALLISQYSELLARFPNRSENEEIYYQLAKAYSLQGNLSDSLKAIEALLKQFPKSDYAAELEFRRGDIYYNLQYYRKALTAYQQVLASENSQAYYVNSLYMSAWTLFKLNRLSQADVKFVSLLDYLVGQEKVQPHADEFSFELMNKQYVSLLKDIQRALSISLSIQEQEKSLVNLVSHSADNEQPFKYLYLYRHILFKNLANFLLAQDLKADAERTYQAYIAMAPKSLWAARYSLALIDLYQQQGKFEAIRQLKIQYVHQYGLHSEFWQQGLVADYTDVINEALLMKEILPNLLHFSYQHSRYLYAQAQTTKTPAKRQQLFATTSDWLGDYLVLAKQEAAKPFISHIKNSQGVLADELLYADASFEAQYFQQAFNSYQFIAYHTPLNKKNTQIQQQAAYAASLTIRKMLLLASPAHEQSNVNNVSTHEKSPLNNDDLIAALLVSRSKVDRSFITQYPKDPRALTLAIEQAQYAFDTKQQDNLHFYSQFVLSTFGVVNAKSNHDHQDIAKQLTAKSKQKVQIVTQLQANYWYQDKQYALAEKSYDLALNYVDKQSKTWRSMRELLASSIYFQGQQIKKHNPLLAVDIFLRLGQRVPESTYSTNAQFDAANILLSSQQWQKGIAVLLAFQRHYPHHEYSGSIPAKLAQAYEKSGQWHLAADQYVIIANTNGQNKHTALEIKREALYSAGELYIKANALDKAINTFRTYAHSYPEPFEIAQEVRFKMSQFYQQTKEFNKQYYWYRKILKYHKQYSEPSKANSARELYLASTAALGLGEAHQRTFNYTKLTLPLKKSLSQKQKSMKRAISYYQQLLSFQLAEFVPHATYNLAEMYQQLSKDVLASQRPDSLDELALEEYELLIEDIAFPFEEKAIAIHEQNAQRTWQNIYDKWVAKSFSALAVLEPALYDRHYRQDETANSKGGINAVLQLH